MSEVNFDDLLDVNMDDVKELPLMPRGTYSSVVMNREFVTSSKKGTPGVQFTFSKFSPADDVSPEEWEEAQLLYKEQDKNIEDRELKYTFWLSKPALPMLKQFIENCGLDVTGRQLRDVIEEAIGSEVGSYVTQEISDNGRTFNTIQKFRKV
jgi:hypothetical protein